VPLGHRLYRCGHTRYMLVSRVLFTFVTVTSRRAGRDELTVISSPSPLSLCLVPCCNARSQLMSTAISKVSRPCARPLWRSCDNHRLQQLLRCDRAQRQAHRLPFSFVHPASPVASPTHLLPRPPPTCVHQIDGGTLVLMRSSTRTSTSGSPRTVRQRWDGSGLGCP
jgi:hypothetical protein